MDKRLRDRLGKVGFVLASGGTRGAWMAGNFLAFKEAGIFPDYISSCSVGSLNGAGIVASQDLETPSILWRNIKNHHSIFKKNPEGRGGVLSEVVERLLNLSERKNFFAYYAEAISIGISVLWNFDRIRNTPSILSPEPLEKLIREINFEDIINSQIEFEVVCAHKSSNQKSVFSNRNIFDPEVFFRAVMASASISGVFPPVDVLGDGEFYVDGATADPLPIYNALEAKCKTIFLFCLHPEKDEVQIDENAKQNFLIKYLPESLKSYLNMQDAQFDNYETNMTNIAKYLPSDVYVLRPSDIPKGIETLFINEENREKMISDGYVSAKRLLKSFNLVPN